VRSGGQWTQEIISTGQTSDIASDGAIYEMLDPLVVPSGTYKVQFDFGPGIGGHSMGAAAAPVTLYGTLRI
jgi:hypothetical protein